jgi:cyclophilin family peptidyl-prolyl cis-trans isomerase
MNEKHEIGSLGLSLERNLSEFYITVGDCEWMNGLTVCFGRVYALGTNNEAAELLKILGKLETLPGGRPRSLVKITQCGLL